MLRAQLIDALEIAESVGSIVGDVDGHDLLRAEWGPEDDVHRQSCGAICQPKPAPARDATSRRKQPGNRHGAAHSLIERHDWRVAVAEHLFLTHQILRDDADA